MNIVGTADNLYDIYDMWNLPFWQTTEFFVAVSGIIIIPLIFIIWRILVRFYKKPKIESPRDRALRELNGLIIQVDPTRVQSKQFYFSLTAIIKNYLCNHYHINVDGLTDEELLPVLEQGILPLDLLEGLRSLFADCTLVKYADEMALKEKLQVDLDYAVTLVKWRSTQEESNQKP